MRSFNNIVILRYESVKVYLEYESMLYNSTNYRLTRCPENFKMKLYYFQERLKIFDIT